jgi:hypothetical protein
MDTFINMKELIKLYSAIVHIFLAYLLVLCKKFTLGWPVKIFACVYLYPIGCYFFTDIRSLKEKGDLHKNRRRGQSNSASVHCEGIESKQKRFCIVSSQTISLHCIRVHVRGQNFSTYQNCCLKMWSRLTVGGNIYQIPAKGNYNKVKKKGDKWRYLILIRLCPL